MRSGDFGQPRLEELLDEMLERGRVNGSFLFEGPVGVGKEALALELGRLLNCENGGLCPAKPPFGSALPAVPAGAKDDGGGTRPAARAATSAKAAASKAGSTRAATSKSAKPAEAKAAAAEAAARKGAPAPGLDARAASPRCNSCHKFDLLAHPDLLLVFPVPKDTWDEKLPTTRGSGEPARNTIGRILHAKASNPYYREDFEEHVNIEADLLRERVIPIVYSRPVEGRIKTVIISDCEQMVEKVANLLLKTLEEPPANCLLVLTTSVPQRLLPTVRSRCQRLHFAALDPAWMQPRLQALYGESPLKARLAATLSQGSMYVAQRYLSGDLDEVREQVFGALAAAGAGEEVVLLDLATALALERRKRRYIVPLFLRLLAAAARDALLLHEGLADDGQTLVNADRSAELQKVARALDPAQLRAVLRGAERAEREIAGQALAEHALGRLFLGMVARAATTSGAGAPARTRTEGRR